MAARPYYPDQTRKVRVTIFTVDPRQRTVEARMKDGVLISLAVWEISAFFRWPRQGEEWTAIYENNFWRLGEYVGSSDVEANDLLPGEARIDADNLYTTGQIFMNDYPIDGAVEDVHIVNEPGEPSFQNSWVNFYTGELARFYRDRNRVYLAGLVRLGTVGSTIFTLPVGYRITEYARLSVASNNAYGQILINPLGNVILEVGSNVWVDLSSVSFRVDLP